MILFYSEHCPHCRMLLDTIKRHDVDKMIRLVSIEALKQARKMPATIHSVPALMLPDTKKLMFGKSVFDYLLLPGSGILLKLQAQKADAITQRQVPVQNGNTSDEPMAFTLGSGSSEMFGMYDEKNENMMLEDRMYTWTSLNDTAQNTAPVASSDAPYQEETRCKIALPNLEYIMQQREMDLRGCEEPAPIANNPIPTPTRVV